MRWPGLQESYGKALRESPVFASSSDLGKKTGGSAEGVKSDDLARPGDRRWDELHKRVIEHVSPLVVSLQSFRYNYSRY